MKGLAELASFHFLEFEWKNSTSRSWAPLRCSLQCVPPPAGVIRVCGGVRGRGLWVTSPGASTLLLVVLLSSFHLRLGGWLLVSFSPSVWRSSRLLRSTLSTTCEGDGAPADSPGSFEIATLSVLCIRRASRNQRRPPSCSLRLLSFSSLPSALLTHR